jgi:hypothetical protein
MRAIQPETAKPLSVVESTGTLQVSIPLPTTKYIDQLLTLRCREELVVNSVFPNAKEVTESFAAIHAIIHRARIDPTTDEITAIVVGDGSIPRTAATLALRTRWRCISVDPALRPETVAGWPIPIRGLELRPQRVQALRESLAGRCVVVSVHAHVELGRAVAAVERCGGAVVAAVAVCCCGYGHDVPGLSLVSDGLDWGIWSPERRVRVWSRDPGVAGAQPDVGA